MSCVLLNGEIYDFSLKIKITQIRHVRRKKCVQGHDFISDSFTRQSKFLSVAVLYFDVN